MGLVTPTPEPYGSLTNREGACLHGRQASMTTALPSATRAGEVGSHCRELAHRGVFEAWRILFAQPSHGGQEWATRRHSL